MRALSGLTPALSRRLQQQLLAHLPPAAASSLRRTLSLHSSPAPPAAPPRPARAHSANANDAPHAPCHQDDVIEHLVAASDSPDDPKQPNGDLKNQQPADDKGVHRRYLRGQSAKSLDDDTSTENTIEQTSTDNSYTPRSSAKKDDESLHIKRPKDNRGIENDDDLDLAAAHVSQFCTLPRLKRNSALSRESTPPSSISDQVGYDVSSKLTAGKEQTQSRGSSIRNTPDRPLLSKYLMPERNLSLDESYSSDCGSILSEPSYIAAYGTSSLGNTSGLGFRRHSMRLAGDQPRKRVSRFLRSDFFDTPPDESLYTKHKKEKELETQKILKEIREKKNRSLDSPKSPDVNDSPPLYKDESAYLRKCLSPVNNVLSRERSRSTTPFFPILDNIKESNLDTSLTITEAKKTTNANDIRSKENKTYRTDEKVQNKESKMARPKSYPIKTFNSFDESNKPPVSDKNEVKDRESEEKKTSRESKLMRPKSYPASSPSPEKIYANRNNKKDEIKASILTKEENSINECENDVEVSFSITLPKKKLSAKTKPESIKDTESTDQKVDLKTDNSSSLALKKYKVIKEHVENDVKNEKVIHSGNGVAVENAIKKESSVDNCNKAVEIKKSDSDSSNKKTVKKKVIKKVSSKSKSDSVLDVDDANDSTDKKKVIKKTKEKVNDDSSKQTTVVKKKSVLQSIGHKLEKFASSKSSSPEKSSQNSAIRKDSKKESSKLSRLQREQSVPVTTDPPTESHLIKRAVTLTDVAALDTPTANQNKTTVSKVLGLFKKFEPKEKNIKTLVENSLVENINETANNINNSLTEINSENDKPRRPTSLLLNGIGLKNKSTKAANDNVPVNKSQTEEQPVPKKDTEPKNIRNTLKLDFSRLPRVKKIVPTNSVIEPQIMDTSSGDNEIEKKDMAEKNGTISDGYNKIDAHNTHERSRSRSTSVYSNSDVKSEHSAEIKIPVRSVDMRTGSTTIRSTRNNESISPEKEDIVDRIRRKSFYSRFNEKKQRRKSSLVGPGAAEYDPVARLHSQPSESKFDVSPTSPLHYDLSPGYSVASDLSPSTDRYRSLLNDLPSNRSNSRYDGLNDKVDMYRSLDRNDFRKYPGKSYLDYDQSGTYGTHRYSRTKSLLDSSEGEDHSLNHLRDPVKYSRTNSLFTPGNYATYRPMRTRNSAIILKESEKEPSPENIMEKIRNRKISISVTRKPDSEDSLPRSNVPPKGEGDGAECSEKID